MKNQKRAKQSGWIKLIILAIVIFFIGYGFGHMSALHLCQAVGKELVEVHLDPEILRKVLENYGGM